MTITMSGLRVYVNPPSANLGSDIGIAAQDTKVDGVFYSRRGNGPIYRWLYVDQVSHWRASRMQDFNSRKLCMASWKSVPESLQTQLGEHYLD